MCEDQLLRLTMLLSKYSYRVVQRRTQNDFVGNLYVELTLMTGTRVVVWHDGQENWYMDDCGHRVDGPAVTLTNGDELWYVYGQRQSNEQIRQLKMAMK